MTCDALFGGIRLINCSIYAFMSTSSELKIYKLLNACKILYTVMEKQAKGGNTTSMQKQQIMQAAERYYDLWYASNQACFAASQQFSTWYKQCGNIQAVLDGYLPFVESLAFRSQ